MIAKSWSRRIAVSLYLSAALLLARSALAALVSPSEFLSKPQSAPDAAISYGTMPAQGVDLYLPKSNGPHPVAILIHGGCWTKRTAGREQLRILGSELTRRGIAVWSIGYRRVDEEGGGYPGTFQDVAKAVDLLRDSAAKYELDLSRVVAIGHSAGAHLALWAASRSRLPRTSPAYVANPFSIRKVIGVGGVGDLERASGIAVVCGPMLAPLVGRPNAARPDVYSDTSPSKMLPSGARVVMITGAEDRITPPVYAETYVGEVKAAGGSAEVVIVPDAGHFDVVTPGTPAWKIVSEHIVAATQ